MKLKAAILLFLSLALPIYAHESTDADATPTPGLVDKTLLLLHLKHAPKPKNAPQLHHQMELKLGIDPEAINLAETRAIKVTLDLYNRSKRYAEMSFPTSQRIEVLVKDPNGKVVNTWSEDQSFTNDPATITVNPGERLEYTVSVATREMTAGQPYIIEASFPSYPDLKIQQTVIPQK